MTGNSSRQDSTERLQFQLQLKEQQHTVGLRVILCRYLTLLSLYFFFCNFLSPKSYLPSFSSSIYLSRFWKLEILPKKRRRPTGVEVNGMQTGLQRLKLFPCINKKLPSSLFSHPPALPLSGFSTDKRAYRERKPER